MREMAAVVVFSLALTTGSGAAWAQEVPQMEIAKDLLLSCQEADNDPRDGFESELECVGFLHGFVAAIETTDVGDTLCFPKANRDDMLRRAFVSWVHKSFRKRSKMPVGEAILAAFQQDFTCQ